MSRSHPKPPTLRIDYRFTGTKTDAVKQIGNAVCPQLAAALQSVHLPKPKAA